MKKQRFLKNKIKFLLLFTIFSVLASVFFIFYKERSDRRGYLEIDLLTVDCDFS